MEEWSKTDNFCVLIMGFGINFHHSVIPIRTIPHGLIKELENECGLPFDQLGS